MGKKILKILKTENPDEWKHLNKKLPYLMNTLKVSMIIKSLVRACKKKSSSVNWKTNVPVIKKWKEQEETIEKFNIKNGEELTQLFLKSDVFLLAYVFEKFLKVSVNEFGIIPLYCVSLPG